jgi:putative ABC transport system permease protein
MSNCVQTLSQDFRYALRQLRKSPGFTAVTVLTLALGIGANTTVFSIADSAMLRPLPYKNAERLAMLWSTRMKDGWRGQASPLDFVRWRQENSAFASIAALRPGAFTLTERGEPVMLGHGQVSLGFFEMLGVAPKLGRLFAPEEHRAGSARVALLSHALWAERFGSDPGIVGQGVRLGHELYTVVGVMPDVRQFPTDGFAVWTPLQLDEAQPDDRHFLFVVGRLQNDTTISRAQAGISTIAERLERDFPGSHAGYGAAVVRLRESFVGPVRPALVVMFGAVGFVLLIACSNVASLLLARASARANELGLRVALGATRWRLVRQMLAESCLLALGGGLLGIVFANWGIALLLGSVPAQLPLPSYVKDIAIDNQVLAFTAVLSVLAGIAFGILPALRSSGLNPNAVLKEGGRTAAASHNQHRLRSALVSAELALTLVLLVAAGLLMKNAVRLQHADPGLKPENVLVMDVSLPPARYNTPERKVAFYREVVQRVRALPGMRHAGLINDLPLRGYTGFNFTIEGRPAPKPGEVPEAFEGVISSDYFQALGIPVRKGRDFEESDGPATKPVVVVNEALVQRYFPGEDPIGKRIQPGGPEDHSTAPWYTIIGVTGNVRHMGLDAAASPEVYTLYVQQPWSAMTLVSHTESEPLRMAAIVKQQIWAVDPDLPISGLASMAQVLADSLWPARVMSYLQGIFALSALLMAAVGLSGVVSQSVHLRRHEFGVRVALGARPGQVLWLVLKQSLMLTVTGLGLGLAGTLALTRVLSALLHDISPTDPSVIAGVMVFLAAVVFIAGYLPARRAMRVDPMAALRCE